MISFVNRILYNLDFGIGTTNINLLLYMYFANCQA